MPEMHLRQPGFTYSACGPFTKTQERIKRFRETGDVGHIYKNDLDKACFQHDLAYGTHKDLENRTKSDRLLRDNAFRIAQDTSKDGYQRSLASMVYKFFDKKSKDASTSTSEDKRGGRLPYSMLLRQLETAQGERRKEIERDIKEIEAEREASLEALRREIEKEERAREKRKLRREQAAKSKVKAKARQPERPKKALDKETAVTLANELHKRIVRKFPRRRVEVSKIDEIWAADLAEMPGFHVSQPRFLLCVIDIYSKYAWVVPLRNKTGREVRAAFSKIFKERKPEKIWVDRGREFYNKDVDSLMDDEDIEMYSTHNEGKSVVAERFIRTLKEKLYWEMTARGTKKFSQFLPEIVKKYNDTIHSRTRQKPSEVVEGSVDYSPDKNPTEPKFSPGDIVRITKYKNIFRKGFTPNWTSEQFRVKKRINTVPWTYSIEDLKGEPVYGTFYEQELQKSEINPSTS